MCGRRWVKWPERGRRWDGGGGEVMGGGGVWCFLDSREDVKWGMEKGCGGAYGRMGK
jgi:hypothetical protein